MMTGNSHAMDGLSTNRDAGTAREVPASGAARGDLGMSTIMDADGASGHWDNP